MRRGLLIEDTLGRDSATTMNDWQSAIRIDKLEQTTGYFFCKDWTKKFSKYFHRNANNSDQKLKKTKQQGG